MIRQRPVATLNDIPVSLFKIVGREVRNKQKVYNALSSLVEDLYEAENSLGKSLLRIGSVPLGFKTDVMMCGVSSLWSNIYKSSTQLVGKQHSNLSVTVMQNVCKIFPEQAKSNIKTIQAILEKIGAQVEEHRRSIKAYQRYYDKYAKLALEIESTVKNRNNASLELEQQSNKSASSIEKDVSSSASSSSSSAQQKHDSQNESFINTIKILTKNTPADVQKRLNDRCRDLIKEFDAAEVMLLSQSKKLLENEQMLIHDIEKAIAKLDDIETSRMKMLREGLNRLYLAEHLLVQRLEEIIEPLKDEMLALDVAVEFNNVVSFIEKLNDKESGTSIIHDEGVNIDKKKTPCVESVAIFSRLDNISSCLEFLKVMLSREMTITQEFAEAERIYSRSIGRALEKNGYGRVSGTNIAMHQMTCAEMLASFESPSIRLGWETSINVFNSFSEQHNNGADVYSSTIFKSLDSLYDKIDGRKKELMDVQTAGMKSIENAQHSVSKLSKKLLKIKGLLSEKREAMRQARADVASEGNSNTTCVNSSIEFETDDGTFVSNDSNSSSNNSYLPRKINQGQEAMLQGIEKLGTSFRATNLSVGLGLETAPERVVRIEAKVSSLEADEIEVTQAVQDAIVKLDAVSDTAQCDAIAIAGVCMAAIEETLAECKTVMKLVVDIFLRNIQTSKNNVYLLKESCEGIEIDVDKLYFYEKMIEISESIRSGDSGLSNNGYDYTPLLLDLTPFQPFDSLDNKFISDERNSLGMSQILSAGVQSTLFTNDILSNSINQNTKTNEPTNNIEPKSIPESSKGDGQKVKVVSAVREINAPSDGSLIATVAPIAKALSSVPLLELTKHITANHFESTNTPGRQNGSLSPTSSYKEGNDLQATSITGSVLAQFGLSGQEKILESYVCALYPKKGFLVQGRMYVTQSYVAFSGWPETRVLLAMSSLVAIEKMNTLNFIPNAIMLRTATDEYFFGSFMDRDPCHALLVSMSSVAKRIVELHGSDLENESNLVFGYQTAVKQGLAAIGLDIGDFDLLSDNKSFVVNQSFQSSSTEISTPQRKSNENNKNDTYDSNNNKSHNNKTAFLNNMVTESNHETVTTRDTTHLPCDVPLSEFKSTIDDPNNKLSFACKYSSIFATHSILPLHEQIINFTTKELYDSLWSKADAFENFLVSEGDLNISTSEWVSTSNVKVTEDPTAISFTQTRIFEYAHPRTSMLMFGPKNAPTKQTHYLHVDTDDGDNISNFVILTITQFDGIPLSDCFKIYQYWICEDSKQSGSCVMRIGMFVHLMKATLFKAQIVAGSKEELTVMCERWGRYALNRLEDQCAFVTPEKAAARSVAELQQFNGSAHSVSVPLQSSRTKQRRISKDVFSSNADEVLPEKTDKRNNKDKKVTSNTSIYFAVIFIMMMLICGQFQYNHSLNQLNSRLRSELDALNRLVQSHEYLLNEIKRGL